MAQRKKKPSGHQLLAIASAQHRNEFMRKFKSFLNSCCGEDIYSLIPPKYLERIYQVRFHSLTVVPAAGNSLPKKLVQDQKLFLSAWIKKDMFYLPQYGLKIILDDYLTIGLTVYSIYYAIADNDFPNAVKVKSALYNYCTDDEPYILLQEQLAAIFEAMGWWICDMGTHLYWFKYEAKIADKGKLGMNNFVEMYKHKPEYINVKINGIFRPAMRLGWYQPITGLEWITMKPSSLKIKDTLSDYPMKVYVQSHALLRLTERIDSILPGLAQFNMISSFNDLISKFIMFQNDLHSKF